MKGFTNASVGARPLGSLVWGAAAADVLAGERPAHAGPEPATRTVIPERKNL